MFEFQTEMWLPRPVEEVFAFFADAWNLERITPPWLTFRVLTPPPITMQKGAITDYRLKLRGIPLRWRSEITVWDPPHRFVDEQRRGPYRAWLHEHTFAGKDRGTVVADHVRYSVWGGALVNRLFVARDLQRIFDYRHEQLTKLLGTG
jgi:ligand-binding SRPBCC domain-containing protein